MTAYPRPPHLFSTCTPPPDLSSAIIFSTDGKGNILEWDPRLKRLSHLDRRPHQLQLSQRGLLRLELELEPLSLGLGLELGAEVL